MQKVSRIKSIQVQREKNRQRQKERAYQQGILDISGVLMGKITSSFSPCPQQCPRQDRNGATDAQARQQDTTERELLCQSRVCKSARVDRPE